MNQKLNIESDIAAINAIEAVAGILEVVCKTTGMGFAAIARLTAEHWIACAIKDEIEFGLIPGGELPIATMFVHSKPIVIEHTTAGAFGSYISVPIIKKNGQFFGTLCAIDNKPAKINKIEIIGMFELFAELIALHLQTQEELAVKEQQLIEATNTAELRDKFIAILGHDVRNPIGAVLNVAELLLRMPVEDRVKKMATIIQRSTYRMGELIENILDFTRGHLGNGIKLTLSNEPLTEKFTQIVEEFRLASPTHQIEVTFDLVYTFSCDGKRITQLFANLLSNALTYGKVEEPVKVLAQSNKNEFVLSVTNKGDKIEDRIMDKLFQPFYRGDLEPSQQGLGLGLYLAAEIAKAHKGKLEVHSNDDFTCFTFSMGI